MLCFCRKLGPEPSLPLQPLVSPTLQPSSEGSEGKPLRRAGKMCKQHTRWCVKRCWRINLQSVTLYSLFCLRGSAWSDLSFFKLLASEPNLKVKHKLKKHLNTRKSPLTRKESAPPTVKHRVSDTLGKRTLNQMKRIVGQFLFSLSVMSLVLSPAMNVLIYVATSSVSRLFPQQQ